MGSPGRPQDSGLEPDALDATDTQRPLLDGLAEVRALLEAEPQRFNFFQAVRLMELIDPGAAPTGYFSDPRKEAVRFGVRPSLSFPPSDIQELSTEAAPHLMNVTFLGLTGPNGAMPHSFTALLEERERAKDYAPRDFLNLFHHRLVSLFFRAWKKHRFPLEFESTLRRRFDLCLLALGGLATPGLQERMEVEDSSVAFYAGLMGLAPRSATALEQILADYFDADVEVIPFAGAWYRLDEDNQCRFEDSLSGADQLGFAVAGDEVWDPPSRVRIRVGPLSMNRYREFLPGESAYRKLAEMVRFFSRGEVEFELQLVLDREEVPASDLAQGETLSLGWTTWMKSRPSFDRSPDDLILVLL